LQHSSFQITAAACQRIGGIAEIAKNRCVTIAQGIFEAWDCRRTCASRRPRSTPPIVRAAPRTSAARSPGAWLTLPVIGFIFLPLTTIVYARELNSGMPTAGINLLWLRRSRRAGWRRASPIAALSGTGSLYPRLAAFASSRSAAIRFCSVRRLIPNISAASLRLPRTCSSVSLMYSSSSFTSGRPGWSMTGPS